MALLETLEPLQSQALTLNPLKDHMRIKELAQATGVDVDTVRYYEKQGLLGTRSLKGGCAVHNFGSGDRTDSGCFAHCGFGRHCFRAAAHYSK